MYFLSIFIVKVSCFVTYLRYMLSIKLLPAACRISNSYCVHDSIVYRVSRKDVSLHPSQAQSLLNTFGVNTANHSTSGDLVYLHLVLMLWDPSIRILFTFVDSLLPFLGTNSLSVLMCR